MDYKNTLNMPSSAFEMKANLNQKEPLIQKKWKELNLENLIYEKNINNKKFIIHDGPPYANGDLHIGHGLNKVLKDFIIRYKNGIGYYSWYLPGWDTHGMPIEIALQKKDKISNLSIYDKREKCKEFANNWIEKQKDQFITMGLLTNFNNIYRTFDKKYEANQIKIFFDMLNKGLIFKNLKPIYWSWSSQTALAEAEVEYSNIESDSIYLTFEIMESKILEKGDKLLVWTTTPWTIPSNLAIAIHPEYEYIKVKTDKGNLIFLKDNIEVISKKINLKIISEIKTFKGKDLENDTYIHPLYEEKILKVILANYIITDGTGLVHNAPGFGNDDYLACKKYNIDVFCPINEFGKFTNEIKDDSLIDKFYIDANPIIMEKLKKSNHLLLTEKISHSTAHDWRTKKPVIYRATDQWFVNLSKIKNEIINSLKKVSSKQGNNIIEKIKEMIENRQEWCISRQRYWGVPIPIIYDENNNSIIDEELQNKILTIFENEGTNSWFINDVKYFLTEKYLNRNLTKEKDIMDVWFDSGTSHTVLTENKFPADLYFEGKDQFRGWFNSSLITSVSFNKIAPYKELLCHGFVLDSQGRKMSKSLGNVIKPLEIFSKYGADVFRIWCASSDYSEDVRISNDILNQSSEIYRRIRNTIFKFILGNLNDFDENLFSYNFSDADIYILNKMNIFLRNVIDSYECFNFKNVIKSINKMVLDLSSWYFEYIKDSLYCDDKNNSNRRSTQTVLFFILKSFITILNPIIPHTTEEVYSHFNLKLKQKSVHLESIIQKIEFPNIDFQIDINKWENFFKFKELIFSKLEEARKNKIINKNNEAKILIKDIPNDSFPLEKIIQYLNVAEIKKDANISQDIIIEKTSNIKCERCWNYFIKENINNDICKRCSLVV